LPTSAIEKFLDELERLWPLSTRAIRAIREHNAYLEDQGYADVILECLDEGRGVTEERSDADGIVWDDGGNLEAD
jgi:hypothetical protein